MRESLNKAANKYAENWEEIHPYIDFDDITPTKVSEMDFKAGAKWQQEQRMYNEEDVLAFGQFCIRKVADFLDGKGDQSDGQEYSMEELFEQFKKQ